MATKRTLTPTFCDSATCPPGKAREEFPDAITTGLALLVTRAGSKSWIWRARHPETRQKVKRTLGSYPAHTLKAARTWANEQTLARESGFDLNEKLAAEAAEKEAARLATAAVESQTVRWFWETHYRPRFPAKDGADLMANRILPVIGSTPMGAVSEADLRKLVAAVGKKQPLVADRVVVALRSFFKRAVEEVWDGFELTANPAMRLRKPDGSVGHRDRALSEDEIVIFYRALLRSTGMVRVHAECLSLLLDVGGRLSEGREMVWDELDFEKGIWELPAERAKNGKAHRMLLPIETLERLKERRKLTPFKWVFFSPLSKGQPYNSLSKSQDKLRLLMEQIAAEDGRTIEKWSAHTLRHSFKTHLYEAASLGIDPVVNEANIDRAQNHTTGSVMGRRYDKSSYVVQKGHVYRFWQDRLMKLRERAEEAERKARGEDRMAA